MSCAHHPSLSNTIKVHLKLCCTWHVWSLNKWSSTNQFVWLWPMTADAAIWWYVHGPSLVHKDMHMHSTCCVNAASFIAVYHGNLTHVQPLQCNSPTVLPLDSNWFLQRPSSSPTALRWGHLTKRLLFILLQQGGSSHVCTQPTQHRLALSPQDYLPFYAVWSMPVL